MSGETAEVHFELYSRREGRWTLDACFADEDEARAVAARISRRGDITGVRLVREVHLPGMADPLVTVLLDTTEPNRPLSVRRAPETAATASGGAPSVLGDGRRANQRGGAPERAAAGARGERRWRRVGLPAGGLALLSLALGLLLR
ncbi:MAG: hypothetical protein GVY33_00260 [Alphaproteobacteria bacterium]|jgi:hypothetical protein|nr:hypothetical protein [Alphaproteobacteria bacterium]